MRGLFVFLLLLSNWMIYAQTECFRLDKRRNLAICLNDSSLYTGICKGFYKNGRIQFFCKFDSGIIRTCLHWDNKGCLLDSSVYTKGFDDKKIVYQLYDRGSLQAIITYKLYKSIDSLNMIIVSEEKYLSKEGIIQQELIYFNDKKKHYILKEHYKNGNLKSSGLYYDSKSFLGFRFMKKDSLYIKYSEDGKKISEKLFKDDKEIIKNKN
jgi:antitoxin component YwqK of YwqJK toxin-antitoxin module